MSTKHDKLLRWRSKNIYSSAAAELADSLSVEKLPYEAIPSRFYTAVVAFRRLRRDARLRICRSFMEKKTP